MASDETKNKIVKAYLACRDRLALSIMKICSRQEDVDDILQETFLRAYSANEKTTIKSPQDYLFVVSRNLVIKNLSRQSREIASKIDSELQQAEDISVDMQVHYQRKFEAFNEALQSLPEKNRRAILLRKFYGLSHKEIAGKMNVSVSSVEKYIANGIKSCKQILCSKGYYTKTEADNDYDVSYESPVAKE